MGRKKERVNQCLTAAGAQRGPFHKLLLQIGPRPPTHPTPPPAPPSLLPMHRYVARKSAPADSLLSGLNYTQHPMSTCARLPQMQQSSQKRRYERVQRRPSPLAPHPLPHSSKNPYGCQPIGLLDRLSIVLRGRGRVVTVIKADALSGLGWWDPATRQLKDSVNGGSFLLLRSPSARSTRP